MTTKEKMELMQAYLDGKQIQYSYQEGEWIDIRQDEECEFDWYNYNFRIKPDQQKAIPATEGELSLINSYAWFRDEDLKCQYCFKGYISKNISMEIFNPESKCWQDWSDK